MTSTPPVRIGLMMREGSYAYQSEVLRGAHAECGAQGADLYWFAGGALTEPDPRNGVYRLPGPGDLDGVVVVSGTFGGAERSAELAELLHRFGPAPVCTIGGRHRGVPSVGIDNASGVRQLVRHLIKQHGRRRIAFVTGDGEESDERFSGYREALNDLGLPVDPCLVVQGHFMPEHGRNAVARLFADGAPPCDAIVTANDWMALGALEALRDRSLRVPEDIALVGFDDIEEARYWAPALTTARQDPRQLAIEATRLVLARVRGQATPPDKLLPVIPQYRRSCGCYGPGVRPSSRYAVTSARGGCSFAEHRGSWVAAARRAVPANDPSLPSDWADRMVDGLVGDLEQQTDHQLMLAMESILAATHGLGNITAWHGPVASLSQCASAAFADAPTVLNWICSSQLRAHLSIGQHAERVQGRRRLEAEALYRQLEATSSDVRTSLDTRGIADALAKHCPKLGVPSCYVTAHPSGATAATDVPVVVSYDARQGDAFVEDRMFRAGSLLADLRGGRRSTMVVQPLLFRNECFGSCFIEVGPEQGIVYTSLSEQLSTALKAGQLARSLIEEGTRRERAERSRLAEELDLAMRIQTGILPGKRRISGLEIAATMLPATEVGGDYFDVLPFDGGCWFGIGDVAGHGMDAGLMMLMIQSTVSASTYGRPDAAPSEIWTAVNAVLYDNVRLRLKRDEHATLTVLRYEACGRLEFAGAHEDLVIYRNKRCDCELVRTPGTWAGVVDEFAPGTIVDSRYTLEPGDVLLLYTDGITEAMNAQREMYGVDRLCAALAAVANGPVERIRDHILQNVQSWMADQADDLTLVVVRYLGV